MIPEPLHPNGEDLVVLISDLVVTSLQCLYFFSLRLFPFRFFSLPVLYSMLLFITSTQAKRSTSHNATHFQAGLIINLVCCSKFNQKINKQNAPLGYGLDFGLVRFVVPLAGTLVWIYLFSHFLICHDG